MGHLHQELFAASGGQTAIYLDKDTLGAVAIRRFARLVALAGQTPRPAEDDNVQHMNRDFHFGARIVSASFASAQTGSTDLHSAMSRSKLLSQPDDDVLLKFDDSLKVEIDIGVFQPPVIDSADPAKNQPAELLDIFSRVSVTFTNFGFLIRPGNDLIRISASDFKVSPHYRRESETVLTDVMARRKITLDDIGRLEGTVSAYAQNLISRELTEPTDLTIAELFPSARLNGRIRPVILQNGRYLGIVPADGIEIDTSLADPCSDPGIGDPVPSTYSGNGTDAKVSFGGLQPIDPATSFGRRAEGEGPVGILLSTDTLMDMTTKKAQSIHVPFRLGGFIGVEIDATISLVTTGFEVDRRNRSFRMFIDLWLRADADFDVDLGCFKRGNFGDGKLESQSTLTISGQLVPSVGGPRRNQTVGLKPARTLDIAMDDLSVRVDIFKYWFIAFGLPQAAWGWAIDLLIAEFLESKVKDRLDGKLKTQFRDYSPPMLAGSKWMEIQRAFDPGFDAEQELVSYNSVHEDTVLLSFGTDGGDPVIAGDLFPYPDNG